MVATQTTSPTDLVVAVLHEVGSGVRLKNDKRLAKLFNEAAQSGGALSVFRWHEIYHDIDALRDALQVLDLGGTIVRENAPNRYFRASAHATGKYGEGVVSRLPESDREAVKALAAAIVEVFQTQQ